MTTEEIQKGNKIIAEFMDEEVILHKGEWQWNSKHNGIMQFMYDSSWDWLMPVVEKIEQLGFNIRIDYVPNGACSYDAKKKEFIYKESSLSIIIASTYISDDDMDSDIIRCDGIRRFEYGKLVKDYKPIEVYWKAAVEFIQWYTTLKAGDKD